MPNWQEKYEELKAEYDALVATHDAIAQEVGRLREDIRKLKSPSGASAVTAKSDAAAAAGEHGGARPSPTPPEFQVHRSLVEASKQDGEHHFSDSFLRDLTHQIVSRAQEDPRVLAVLVSRPELRVHVARTQIEAEGSTLKGALAILISEKFFDRARPVDEARGEVIRRGVIGNKTPSRQVSQALESLAELGFLTREESGYQAVPGMKVHILERNVPGEGSLRGKEANV